MNHLSPIAAIVIAHRKRTFSYIVPAFIPLPRFRPVPLEDFRFSAPLPSRLRVFCRRKWGDCKVVKSIARSALILAIGLCAAFAAPSHAATGDRGRAAILIAWAGNGTPPASVRAPAGQVAIVPDRLTAADRALRDPGASSPAPAVATAALSSPVPAAGTAPRAASLSAATNGGHSLWGKTSLIGKIFVGIGAVLTLASAARMFMT